MVAEILGCLLGENLSEPKIEELRVTPVRCLPARAAGETAFMACMVSEAAGLDGDELGCLLGRIARIKRLKYRRHGARRLSVDSQSVRAAGGPSVTRSASRYDDPTATHRLTTPCTRPTVPGARS